MQKISAAFKFDKSVYGDFLPILPNYEYFLYIQFKFRKLIQAVKLSNDF